MPVPVMMVPVGTPGAFVPPGANRGYMMVQPPGAAAPPTPTSGNTDSKPARPADKAKEGREWNVYGR